MAGRRRGRRADRGTGRIGQDACRTFLAAIDGLVRRNWPEGLRDATQVVYVSPLKALSNDIHRNLEDSWPASARRCARWACRTASAPACAPAIRRPVSASGCAAARRIVVTTPESLYILLGSASASVLTSTRTVIVYDEIHALAPNKRGAHLALSLERTAALCSGPLLRIGLSAAKPIDAVARFLVACPRGYGGRGGAEGLAAVHDHRRRPSAGARPCPRSAGIAARGGDVGRGVEQVYDPAYRGASHHPDLRQHPPHGEAGEPRAVRAARPGAVTAHHGSLAKEQRLDAEQRLKRGALKALVATASLELGIDIGDIDLVCQLGSPRSIASLLQRAGRSGHAVVGTPKCRLFPLSRDELVECAALLDSIGRGELDRLSVPDQPLDVLAQQIVAEVAARVGRGRPLPALPPGLAYRALAARL
ncbi:MAG: helicase-related protein [Rhodospirillales bacterium]